MRAHERLDLRVRVPLFPVYLIASDMKTLIGKKLGHFADEFIEKMVSMLFCWIHGWIKHSPFALDLIWPRRAGQVGIADKPGGPVARHIEFGSHANASIARVGDHIAHFALRVIQPVGAHLVQLGKFFALDAEALVFRQMPVKTLSFTAAMPSRLRLMTSRGMKWRPASIIRPRQGKRGLSSILTARAANPAGLASTNSQNAFKTRITPMLVAALIVAPYLLMSSR